MKPKTLFLILLCILLLCLTVFVVFALLPAPQPDSPDAAESTSVATDAATDVPDTAPAASTAAVTESPATTEPVATTEAARRLVVIDPGHQLHGDHGTEPVGPGATEQKMRVSDGTQGQFTGIPEHELALAVSFMLRDELERRGYEVVLTRETADVSISNAERSQIANDLQADAFVRIHANGSLDASVSGCMTICMTENNPYNAALYAESYALSNAVLDCLCQATGARKEYVWQTDTMTGINYSQVPVTIVEIGYMTNETEDRLLATDEYRQTVAVGIADGIDRFFEEQE